MDGCGVEGPAKVWKGGPCAATPPPSRVLCRSKLLVKLPGEPGGEGRGGEMDGSCGEGIGDAARAARKHSTGAILDLDTCGRRQPVKKASKELERSRGVRLGCGDCLRVNGILSGG